MRKVTRRYKNWMLPTSFAELKDVSHQTIMNYVNRGEIEIIHVGTGKTEVLFIDSNKYKDLTFPSNRTKNKTNGA